MDAEPEHLHVVRPVPPDDDHLRPRWRRDDIRQPRHDERHHHRDDQPEPEPPAPGVTAASMTPAVTAPPGAHRPASHGNVLRMRAPHRGTWNEANGPNLAKRTPRAGPKTTPADKGDKAVRRRMRVMLTGQQKRMGAARAERRRRAGILTSGNAKSEQGFPARPRLTAPPGKPAGTRRGQPLTWPSGWPP
jgi:hypothetical protein